MVADRDRSVTAHAAARRALGQRLGMHPRRVPLETSPSGQPRVEGSVIGVSWSHSGRWVALAIVQEGAVGVDIERRPDIIPVKALRALGLESLEEFVAREAAGKATVRASEKHGPRRGGPAATCAGRLRGSRRCPRRVYDDSLRRRSRATSRSFDPRQARRSPERLGLSRRLIVGRLSLARIASSSRASPIVKASDPSQLPPDIATAQARSRSACRGVANSRGPYSKENTGNNASRLDSTLLRRLRFQVNAPDSTVSCRPATDQRHSERGVDLAGMRPSHQPHRSPLFCSSSQFCSGAKYSRIALASISR